MADVLLTSSEYEERVSRLQTGMAVQAVDTLLLTTPADVFYLTGFLTRFWESPARPWFVIVPANNDPIAVIPAIGAELMGNGWLRDIRTWDAPDPIDDGVTLLCDTLLQHVPAAGKIGLPMGLETHLRMPLNDFLRVQEALQDRFFVDATDVVQRVREVKSDAEIALIRDVCAIAGRAFGRVPEIARRGVNVDAVFRGFQGLLLDEGADWVSYLAGGAGPGGYGDVISPAKAAPLSSGDILMLDTGAVKNGYFCDFDRNYSVGPASNAVKRTHEALFDATEHALQNMRPGHTAQQVHEMMYAHLEAAGHTPLGGRLGHGLGITLTEWPSLSAKDQTPLVEGMVLTLEPGVEIAPGRILVHEENLVLRADGAELLSPRAPREMVELPI